MWKVIETKIEIDDPENPTTAEEVLLQNNDIALRAIHDATLASPHICLTTWLSVVVEIFIGYSPPLAIRIFQVVLELWSPWFEA